MKQVFIEETLIAWLLDGDVAVQYQVQRDLLGQERPDLRARFATEGWGARFLAAASRPATGAAASTSPNGRRPTTRCWTCAISASRPITRRSVKASPTS